MPRSGAAARQRLERAALELYSERGYEQTTAVDIAARAGVTARTFFRHFADKREVLFGTEVDLRKEMAEALAAAPPDLAPLEAVLQAFRSMGATLETGRPLARMRHQIIAQTPALRERELAKSAAMSTVVADALRQRGLPDWRAALFAQVTAAALGHVVHTWTADPTTDFDALVTEAFAELRTLSHAASS